jgi:hypothetical protein
VRPAGARKRQNAPMMPRAIALAGLTVAIALCARLELPVAADQATLPDRLTDREFWQLTVDLSEPDGFFRSDNLVSNEDTWQTVLPRLVTIVKPGGVYLGVGPDQNFTYVVALQPKIAFITDVRRGNLQAHLMYKALFELSPTRADFLARLFSRPRPAGLTTASSPAELFAAFALVGSSAQMYSETMAAIREVLVKRRGFGVTEEDLAGIEYVLSSFRAGGPFLAYGNTGGGNPGGRFTRYPSFQDLQLANDGEGRNRAYLATEDNYRAIKSFQERNLLVPVVGNFAGPKALRAVGGWVKARRAMVTTFYLSNVEQYLFGDGIWMHFAANVAELPLDESSTFIRSCFSNCVSPYPSRAAMQIDSMTGLLKDVRDGKIRTYGDVLSHVR